jgi:hypothetical protein
LNAILSSSNLRRIYINSGCDEMKNDQKILDKRFSFNSLFRILAENRRSARVAHLFFHGYVDHVPRGDKQD